MNNKFKTLDPDIIHKDSVVSFCNSIFKIDELVSFSHEIFCDIGVGELYHRLINRGKGHIPSGKNSEWINNGKECELLVPGTKGWQKGKIRIKVTLEFCSEEPEVEETLNANNTQTNSKEQSLDEIRHKISQVN